MVVVSPGTAMHLKDALWLTIATRSILEIHFGSMCANLPACKAFWMHYFKRSSHTRLGSQSTITSTASTLWEKMSFWKKISPNHSSCYLSESHTSNQGAIVIQDESNNDIEMWGAGRCSYVSMDSSNVQALPPLPRPLITRMWRK
jgi:hypothetical protein